MTDKDLLRVRSLNTQTTTIKVRKDTWEKLWSLKKGHMTMDDVIRNILNGLGST